MLRLRSSSPAFLCLTLTALIALSLSAAPEPPASPDAALLKQKIDRGDMKGISETAFRQLMATAEPMAILDAALLILKDHPQYTATLIKQERIRGDWQEVADVIALQFQRDPMSAFLQWIGGPHRGRKVLYNKAASPDEIRVKESGLLGLFSISLRLDNPLMRRDSNHSIVELGLEYPLQRIRQDLKLIIQNGLQVIDPSKGDWIEADGRRYWEIQVESPGPPVYYTRWARLRFDIETGMMVTVESRDASGQRLEKISYQDVRWTTFGPGTFAQGNPAHGM